MARNDYLPSVPASHPATPPHRIRAAIVEDDAAIRTILRQWIKQSPDFECVFDCGDAETAMVELAAHAPDVALVDINLPGASGIECVRRLKLLRPATQFVMLTVYEDSDHIFAALAAGATGYMLKRTPREGLLAALREVHAGGSPMSSNIARKVVQSLQPQPKARSSDLLSARESEVLELLSRGHVYKEIAEKIGISLPTVSTYIRRIYEKLHVHSRAQAIAAYTAGIPESGSRSKRQR